LSQLQSPLLRAVLQLMELLERGNAGNGRKRADQATATICFGVVWGNPDRTRLEWHD
jgi:hypothetical protein